MTIPTFTHQTFDNLSDDALITSKEFAELLGVKENTIAIWICTNRYDLPFIKIGRLTRHRVGDVRRVLQEGLN